MDIVSAILIPVGSTLVHAHWSIPRGYVSPGPSFKTQAEALECAIREVTEAVRKHNEYYAGQLIVPLPESITLDFRWTLEHPDRRGSTDLVVAREVYPDLDAASRALVRLRELVR